MRMFHALLDAMGSERRHAGNPPFETAVEILLGRGVSPAKTEPVMDGLRRAGLLDPAALYALGEAGLAERIRPAGHYRQKAGRLLHFLRFLREECDFDIERLAAWPLEDARAALAAVRGVGPETADAILLLACGFPVFPVSQAAARLVLRHGLAFEEAGYEDIQDILMGGLDGDARLYAAMYGLIARTGREFCKPKAPLCAACPLGRFLE